MQYSFSQAISSNLIKRITPVSLSFTEDKSLCIELKAIIEWCVVNIHLSALQDKYTILARIHKCNWKTLCSWFSSSFFKIFRLLFCINFFRWNTSPGVSVCHAMMMMLMDLIEFFFTSYVIHSQKNRSEWPLNHNLNHNQRQGKQGDLLVRHSYITEQKRLYTKRNKRLMFLETQDDGRGTIVIWKQQDVSAFLSYSWWEQKFSKKCMLNKTVKTLLCSWSFLETMTTDNPWCTQ